MSALSFSGPQSLHSKTRIQPLACSAGRSCHCNLRIGQVYAFSVFKKPLNYLIQVATVGRRTEGASLGG